MFKWQYQHWNTTDTKLQGVHFTSPYLSIVPSIDVFKNTYQLAIAGLLQSLNKLLAFWSLFKKNFFSTALMEGISTVYYLWNDFFTQSMHSTCNILELRLYYTSSSVSDRELNGKWYTLFIILDLPRQTGFCAVYFCQSSFSTDKII